MTIEQIFDDLKKKIYHPVYFLQGDEPYYIDQVSDYIEKNVLTESEKEFNQTIVYGKDLDIYTLISYAKRYPMMSNYQVIIVKEAQNMKSLVPKKNEEKDEPAKKIVADKNNLKNKKDAKEDLDPFTEYILKPTPTTILVFCYKYGSVDKRTKIAKIIGKQSVLFDSKKLYDNQLPAWISKNISSHKMKIDQEAVELLAESLGNDLTKIANEIEKLCINLKPGEVINSSMIAENIGISKEFNIFELQKAIGLKNNYKAFQIAEYFSANPKNNPIQMTIPQLYSYFMKLLTYHSLSDRTKNNTSSVLQVGLYYVDDYIKAAKEYPPEKCIRNIHFIRDYDLKVKGINDSNPGDGELLKELIFKIMH